MGASLLARYSIFRIGVESPSDPLDISRRYLTEQHYMATVKMV